MKAGFSIKLLLYFAPNCLRRIGRAELSCAELSGHHSGPLFHVVHPPHPWFPLFSCSRCSALHDFFVQTISFCSHDVSKFPSFDREEFLFHSRRLQYPFVCFLLCPRYP